MLNRLQFEFRPYARPFKRPLQTHYGEWAVREGIILRLTDQHGRVGWGEIAPIEVFGSESWPKAFSFCQSLSQKITLETIQKIPVELPACRFGFEAAWEMLASPLPRQEEDANQGLLRQEHGSQVLLSSILLPTGADALNATQLWTAKPSSTFKWKIGIAPIQQELELLEELISLLPPRAKLRLDANGGLTWQHACQWLQVCDGYGIEFLEQPLPPDQFQLMLKLSQRYSTPIALDESVTNLASLQACYCQGWRGLFVIKAPIAGFPSQLRQWCQDCQPDIVWSSVFETAIARRYIASYLIAALPPPDRAIGFGIEHWFADYWEERTPEQIWDRLRLE